MIQLGKSASERLLPRLFPNHVERDCLKNKINEEPGFERMSL